MSILFNDTYAIFFFPDFFHKSMLYSYALAQLVEATASTCQGKWVPTTYKVDKSTKLFSEYNKIAWL